VSSDLRARFERDGYAILPDFVDPAACDALRARAGELMRGHAREDVSIFTTKDQATKTDDYVLDSGDRIAFFFEEEDPTTINKLGHAMHDLDPVFDAFSRTPAIASLVDELGLDEPRLIQSMYILKSPRVGGEVRCHQDSTFLHTSGDRVIGLWFALEDARVDNGCLWAIPGGHRSGLKARFIRDGRTTRMETIDPTPFDQDALVPLEVAKGSVIVLDGLVPHMSFANRSPCSRHAYTLHVISARDEYPATNWLRRATPPRGFR